METYATWARLFELLPHYSWIVDRFHLPTQAHQLTARGREIDFRWLEDRLHPLGFRLVLLTRAPSSFAKAREERLKISGNPTQYDDLEPFVREQALYQRLVADSILPTLEVDVSDNDVHGATERIADWLEVTGGLWSPADAMGMTVEQ